MTKDQEQPLIAHLVELRNRLLRSILLVLVLFLSLFYFANDLYLIMVEPLSRLLPSTENMIATSVTSPFLVPFKMTLVLSVMIAIPYILHQIWAFISPGLYRHEKRFGIPLLISSILLFYSGVAFAYFVVLPLVFAFFTATGPAGISFLPDISNILNFILKLFFAFGVTFEIPIATFLMVSSGITTVEALSKKRPYVFIGCFVVGMLITPPDIFSQTILAVPMYLLFEFGILFSRLVKKKEPAEAE